MASDRQLKRRFLTFTRLGSSIDERGIGGAQAFRNRLRLSSAWPSNRNTDFRLVARGGFVVKSSVRAGHSAFVEIHSMAGQVGQLENPWRDLDVDVWRNGRVAEDLLGELLRVATGLEETFVVAPGGTVPTPVRIDARQ